MFEGLDLTTAIFLIVLWLLSTVVSWMFIIPYFFKRYVKNTIVEMLSSPDEVTKQAIAALSIQILFSPIKTGKKVKDEDGKEHDEVLPLYRFMGRELSNYFMMKLKGMRGGTINQAGADLVEADPTLSALVSGGFGPRKGQTSMEWVMEQAMMRLMPVIEKKMGEVLNKTGNNASSEWGQ